MTETVFVGRERELERLDQFLGAALAGQGQVCFLSGEAGSGKSALVTEFARRAEKAHPEILAVFGQADAHTGIGDPYLPFREMLRQFSGETSSEQSRAISDENSNRLHKFFTVSGRLLVEIAPDLVGLFLPGAGFAIKLAKETADKTGWLEKLEKLAQRSRDDSGLGSPELDQNLVFEQYTRFIVSLAEKKPLLIILDDLQWADPSSLALLFRLGRRMAQSRILIVGTYRAEEVSQGRTGERHPLEKVIAEMKRYQGDIELSLDQTDEAEKRRFVDQFLDSEPNALDENFRKALLKHTDGHALFTVELLRVMQERGDLVQDAAGRWVPGSMLAWDALPARVEGVVEERIGRLTESLRETLKVASVEGEEFTAEVVAQVQKTEVHDLVRRLSEDLQKGHRLVSAEGLRQLDKRRLAVYRFQHNLFQKYLYNGLDKVERAYLHEDVGTVLEALYGEQCDEIAVQLARHFEEAGIADKAAHYLRRSGELAAARYAGKEAIDFLSRALALLPEKDYMERYRVLLARERVYDRLGQREAEKQDLLELVKLAGELDVAKQAKIGIRQTNFALLSGKYEQAEAAAKSAVELSQAAGLIEDEAQAHLLWGSALFDHNFPGAQTQFEEGVALAKKAGLSNLEAHALINLSALGLYDPVVVQSNFEKALVLYQKVGDRAHEQLTMNDLAWIFLKSGDFARAWDYTEKSIELGREMGFRRGEMFSLTTFADIYTMVGDYAQARDYLDQAIYIAREIIDRWSEGVSLSLLAMLNRRQREFDKAKALCDQALLLARDLVDYNLESLVLRAFGDICLDLDDLAEARVQFERALELMRRMNAAPDEKLETLAGLAEANLKLGELAKAKENVADILTHLDGGGKLSALARPSRSYLTCYRVLLANGDTSAAAILAAGYRHLQKQARRIPDEAMRRSFLENVTENRELAGEFAHSQKLKINTKKLI